MKIRTHQVLAFLLMLPILLALEPTAWADEHGKVTLTGKLLVPPEAGTKESYLTGNFQLATTSGKHIVAASEEVSEETLATFVNMNVKIQATLIPAQAPDPSEQAPMSPSGPLDHPAYYRVWAIKVVAP